MDRPNRIASVTTGRKASTGPALPRPNASVPQPHWKNAVSTPNVAAAAIRFITAAVGGRRRGAPLLIVDAEDRGERRQGAVDESGHRWLRPLEQEQSLVAPPARRCGRCHRHTCDAPRPG